MEAINYFFSSRSNHVSAKLLLEVGLQQNFSFICSLFHEMAKIPLKSS